MKLKKRYYRRVVKIGGGRYLAIGSFAPKDWRNVRLDVSVTSLKIFITLENLDNGKRASVSESRKPG